MKRRWILSAVVTLSVCLTLTGCGNGTQDPSTDTASEAAAVNTPISTSAELQGEKTSEPDAVSTEEAAATDTPIDVDLTELSSTLIYAEVYNMVTAPEEYTGKMVKMSGQFAVYHDESTDQYYYAVIIADATACCSQGLEFVWSGSHTYPDDYPALDSEITVTGEFQTYEENGYLYIHLINADLSYNNMGT